MTREIMLDRLLEPIDEISPAGSDLRYTTAYEEIMEARRCEDAVALGDWQHAVKCSDWEKVITLCDAALRTKSKDLQICAWLVEALTVMDGFDGLELGLRLMAGMVDRFWENIYPLAGDEDLEYRTGPFEFLNEKVALQVRQVPLTDKSVTPGYCWLKWQESRVVGFEADTRNRFGDIDEEKKRRRDECLAENALTAEEFDAAAARCSAPYLRALLESLKRCCKSVQVVESAVGARFGSAAPSLAGLEEAVEACTALVQGLVGTERVRDGSTLPALQEPAMRAPEEIAAPAIRAQHPAATVIPAGASGKPSETLWGEALLLLEGGDLQAALALLLDSSNSSESIRDRNRVRLLMVKLCLRAGRTDLARPIVEELHGVIEELHLERWESPVWIAEVLEAYYQCLQAAGLPDDDLSLSRALFRRICSLDVTKAMPYRI